MKKLKQESDNTEFFSMIMPEVTDRKIRKSRESIESIIVNQKHETELDIADLFKIKKPVVDEEQIKSSWESIAARLVPKIKSQDLDIHSDDSIGL